MIDTADVALNRFDVPANEQRQIVDLYRSAVLAGSEAQLIGPDHEVRKLPASVYRLLVRILKDLSDGASVTILQERNGLTTVQASRILGVSRQFLVNLLEAGEIPFHKVGSHRRVYFKDLVAYRERRNESRRAVLREMVRSESEAGLYDATSSDDFSAQ